MWGEVWVLACRMPRGMSDVGLAQADHGGRLSVGGERTTYHVPCDSHTTGVDQVDQVPIIRQANDRPSAPYRIPALSNCVHSQVS